MKRKLKVDFDEPSTWRGLAWFVGFLVAFIAPDKAIQALTAAGGFAGAMGLFFKDAN